MLSMRRATVSKYLDLPNGLPILIAISLLIMFDFSMLTHSLLIYCTNYFDFNENAAWLLYRYFVALSCTLPLIGGWLTHNLLSYRASILFGLTSATIGLFLLCFHTLTSLYIGLSCILIGIGLAAPAVLITISLLLDSTPAQRSQSYVLIFICITLASLVSTNIAIPIANEWGFQGCFLLAAIATLVALMIFLPCLTPFINNRHAQSLRHGLFAQAEKPRQSLCAIALLLALIPLTVHLLQHPDSQTRIIYGAAILSLGYSTGCYLNHSEEQRQKLRAYFYLITVSIGFWTLYMFLPSILSLFIEKHAQELHLTSTIANISFLNVNACLLIITGIMGYLLLHHRQRLLQQHTGYRFVIATLLLATAFFILDFGLYFANTHSHLTVLSIVFSFTLQALAQLYIVPSGLGMVCRLTPHDQHGIFMGIWIFSLQIGNCLASQLLGLTAHDANHSFLALPNDFYAENFTRFGIMAITIAILTGLLAPKIQAAIDTRSSL